MKSKDILTHHKIRRIALIVNPAAAKGNSVQAARIAVNTFVRSGVDVVQLSGASPKASLELVKKALAEPEYDALVVCGGDGLISLALQQQANTDIPLGIIPAGTGNDHAREYYIPLDPQRAAEVVMEGYATRTDLGVMRNKNGDSKYFGTVACLGFDSLVSDRTNAISFPRGKSRYIVAGLIEWLRFHPHHTRILVDGKLVFSGPVTMATIGNTKSYGGGMEVCPRANHHDGLLDLSLLKNLTRAPMGRHINPLLNGTWWKLPQASMYRGKNIRVEMPEITAYADGDPYWGSPVECEVAPQAGYYLVPRP